MIDIGPTHPLMKDIKKHCIHVWLHPAGPYRGIVFTRSLLSADNGEHQEICVGLDDLGYIYKVNAAEGGLIHYDVIFKTSPDIVKLKDNLTDYANGKDMQYEHSPFKDIKRIGMHEYILTFNFKLLPDHKPKGPVLTAQDYCYSDLTPVMTDTEWEEALNNIKKIMQFE